MSTKHEKDENKGSFYAVAPFIFLKELYGVVIPHFMSSTTHQTNGQISVKFPCPAYYTRELPKDTVISVAGRPLIKAMHLVSYKLFLELQRKKDTVGDKGHDCVFVKNTLVFFDPKIYPPTQPPACNN